MLTSLHDLLLDELRDLYSAERQLVRAMPRIVQASSTPALTDALRDHLAVTETQVGRLVAMFESLQVRASGRKCRGMSGLLAEGKDVIANSGSGAVRDAGLVGAAQRIEHYEIAAYGAALRHAELLGQEQIAALLFASLEEEKAADDTLAALASREVNAAAMAAAAGSGPDR